MNKGHSVDTLLLTEKNKYKIKDYDLIGIGYPIHAFNAPKVVEDKLKKLKITSKKYFIYKNGGQPHLNNQASSYKIYKIMKKGKNELMGEYEFVMPTNYGTRTSDEFIRYAHICQSINVLTAGIVPANLLSVCSLPGWNPL